MKISLVLIGLAMAGMMALEFWPHGRPETNDDLQEEITVLVAASLVDAMEQLGDEFERNHRVRVRFDFAASGVLRAKIEAGASADLFLSASRRHMDLLEAKELLDARTRRSFLRNELVCVIPSGSTLNVHDSHDLTHNRVQRIAVGDAAYVPAGEYGKRALLRLGLWRQLQHKLVPCADARATLAQTESGAADAAIVYSSDTVSTEKVKVAFVFSPHDTAPITYPGCVLKGSQNPHAAQMFLDFLLSPKAARILIEHGFQPVSGRDVARSADTSEELM